MKEGREEEKTDLTVSPGISAPLSAASRHETRDAIQRRDPAQPDLVRDHRTVPSLLTSAAVVVAVVAVAVVVATAAATATAVVVVVVVAAVAAECACQWER